MHLHMMTGPAFVTLIVLLLVGGFAVFILGRISVIDDDFKLIIKGALLIGVLVYVLYAFGLFG